MTVITTAERRGGGSVAAPARPGGHDGLDDYLDVRDRLLRIARRIVVTSADAEDVVQDAWLRWNHTDRTVVRNPPAFLCRTTTRLSLTRTRTAYARRQTPAGLCPADPVDPGSDPAAAAETAEHLRAAMSLLVTRLSRRERVAYALREAFDLPYRQIGDLLGLTEPNARQLIRRARIRLATGNGRTASPADQLELLAAFLDAASAGDPAILAGLAQG